MKMMISSMERDNLLMSPLFLSDEEADDPTFGNYREATQGEIESLYDVLEQIYARRKYIPQGVSQALNEVRVELQNALKMHKRFNSAHEAYGVIVEELRELEEHVFTNPSRRNVAGMRSEACQLAAMALRLMVELC